MTTTEPSTIVIHPLFAIPVWDVSSFNRYSSVKFVN